MGKYGMALMPIAFLLLTGTTFGQPPSLDDRDIVVRSYEGFEPNIEKFVLGGRFETTGDFVLEVIRRGDYWNVKFSQGKASSAVMELPIRRYSPINFSKVVVSTRSRSPRDNHVLVVIPFGNSQTSCFVNGNEVFEEVLLMYDSEKLVKAEELAYNDCKSEYRPLRMDAPDKP